MPSYTRLETNKLVEVMSNSGSTTDHWDVLCSYDVQALNRVLLEEYKKFPVNSELGFLANNNVSRTMSTETNCSLKFDNPTLSFSSVQGFYNLKIPISNSSYCNQTIFLNGNIHENTTITIPHGYNILTSGPLGIINGATGRNNITIPFNQTVEFGDSKKASIVLHFRKNLRQVEVSKDSNIPSNSDKKYLLDNIKNHFADNIQEVDYNIVQVVKDTAKLRDIVLTPKSFIVTTMADQEHPENGVLNIWIQLNESDNPPGNPNPSFYPNANANVLPIPNGHDSSIIFSEALIRDVYLKRPLKDNFDVSFTNNKAINIKLLPKENFEFDVQSHLRRDRCEEGEKTKCGKIKINYNDTPFFLSNYNASNSFLFTFKSDHNLECSSKKIEYIASYGCRTSSSTTFDHSITISVNKYINFTINNDSINEKNITIEPRDIHISQSQGKTEQHNLLIKLFENLGAAKTGVTSFYPVVESEVKNHLSKIKLGFSSLNYFAEANILFHEERFKIANDTALYFPGDAIIVGDIVGSNDTNHIRSKRHSYDEKQLNNQNIDTIDNMSTEGTSSSANRIESPVNTAINWLSSSLGKLKFFSPTNLVNYEYVKDGIQSIFGVSKQINNDITQSYSNSNSMNIAKCNVNESLTLADFLIRCVTKVKPYNTKEESIDLLEVKAYILNIVTKFEEMLNDSSIPKHLSIETLEFDPVVLISQLEEEIISGNPSKLGEMLYQYIVNSHSHFNDTELSAKIQDKIYKILEQESEQFIYNQELNTGSSIVSEDMANTIIGIAGDVNHTNYQSEANMIG